MDAYKAFARRETEDAIIITFRNWTGFILYDSRKDGDVPCGLMDYPTESITVTDGLTIIEI